MFKKGPWTASEDAILVAYVNEHGEGNWNSVQKRSGLCRCGKSCRLRWANHLRPNLKKGAFTPDEERMIFDLHAKLGNKWARMATVMPGRTDNEIKNYWNTRIKRRMRAGISPYPHETCGSLNHCLPKFEQGVYNSNKKEQSCSLLKNTSLGISTQWPGRMNGRAKNIADDDAVYDFEGFCAVMEVGNVGMNNNGGCSSAASSVAVTSSGGLRSELPSSQVIVSLDNPSEPDFSFHLLSEADNSSFVNTNSGLLDSLLYNQHDNIMYAAKEDAENIKTGIVDVAPDFVITTAITRVDVPIEMVNNSEQNQWESLLQVSNTQIKGEANAEYTDHEISTVIGFAKPDELSTMLDLEKPDPVILSEWYTTSATNNNTTPIGEDCTVPTAAMENTQEGLQDSIIYNMVNNHQYIMWGDMGSCSWNNMHYLLKVEMPSKYRLGF